MEAAFLPWIRSTTRLQIARKAPKILSKMFEIKSEAENAHQQVWAFTVEPPPLLISPNLGKLIFFQPTFSATEPPFSGAIISSSALCKSLKCFRRLWPQFLNMKCWLVTFCRFIQIPQENRTRTSWKDEHHFWRIHFHSVLTKNVFPRSFYRIWSSYSNLSDFSFPN